MKKKSQNIALLVSFLLLFGVGEIVAQPRYAKMTDTVFHVGDLIQHRFEARHALCTRYKTICEEGGVRNEPTSNIQLFLELVQFIKSHPNLILEISSHTDWRGSAASNLDLSQRRANSIVQCMFREYGIDSTQVKAVGYGREKPRTMFTCKGHYWVYPDDSIAQNCEENPELITLTNDYINQFKENKVLFERLHQFNRRIEVKVVGIRNLD